MSEAETTKPKRRALRPGRVLAEYGAIDTCPLTGERQRFVALEGAEAGRSHLTLTTKGRTTRWRHTIISEEI
jgi:hypothetical protein